MEKAVEWVQTLLLVFQIYERSYPLLYL